MPATHPLKGLLVVSIEHAAAAPFASSRLADAGARVIKVERPSGDSARGYDDAVNGLSAFFVWLNRGKESVILDYKQEADMAVLKNILAKADVFIQNLGPGAMKRAGLGHEELRKQNPRLITCDISGYGEDGPYADKGAYDLLIQAESGIASITGLPEAPGRIGVSACDIGTGMYAYSAILEALIQRGISGEGSAIHVSLFGAMTEWMALPLLHHDYAGTIWPRVGLSHPLVAPYGAYKLKDGSLVIIGVQNDREWQRLAEKVLKSPEMAKNGSYLLNIGRVENREVIDAEISRVMGELDPEEAFERLESAKIACAAVNDVSGVSVHPQLQRITVDTSAGPVDMVAPPARFKGVERNPGPVPDLGEHTEKIREEFGV